MAEHPLKTLEARPSNDGEVGQLTDGLTGYRALCVSKGGKIENRKIPDGLGSEESHRRLTGQEANHGGCGHTRHPHEESFYPSIVIVRRGGIGENRLWPKCTERNIFFLQVERYV